MIVALNYALPILLLIVAFIGYKTKKYIASVMVALALVIVYQAVQPTYIPKGTVPAMQIKQTEYVDKPIVDRTRKVLSPEERDARMEKQRETTDARIEKLIGGEK